MVTKPVLFVLCSPLALSLRLPSPLQATIATIQSVQRAHNITDSSLLNFCVSDGSALLATRYVSPPTNDAASLYYAEGGCGGGGVWVGAAGCGWARRGWGGVGVRVVGQGMELVRFVFL